MSNVRHVLVVSLVFATASSIGATVIGSDPSAPPTISVLGDRFFDVKALSPDRALVLGYGGRMLETRDGGRSWHVVPTPTERALYAISFASGAESRSGWVCGAAGLILHTTDGGTTWQRQESGTDVHLFAVHAVNATQAFAVGDRAVLLQTRDAGATWESRTVPHGPDGILKDILLTQDPILYDVTFVDERHGWIVGEFGTLQHTADGGRTWTTQHRSLLSSLRPSIFDLPSFFGVHFANRREGIAVGIEGRIVRTSDGGVTWMFETIDEAVAVDDPLYAPFLLPDGTAWAIGSGGEVVTRATGQSTWKRATLGMEVHTWFRGIDFFDHDHGWIVGGFGTILRTQDGGETWTPIYG